MDKKPFFKKRSSYTKSFRAKKPPIGYLKKDNPAFVTLYVGNLRYNKDEKSLLDIFKKYGYVHFVKVTRDKRTQKSNGTAFIQMGDSEAATKAIKSLDGIQFEGRTLRVSVALETEKKERPKPFRRY